jgi:predicted DCC family thiol-disulfide oxidoreductase YuxK
VRDVRHVVFDDTCGFCARSIAFIARHDGHRRVVFVPRSDAAALSRLGAVTGELPGPGSVVLVEDGVAYTRSTAALRIARLLDAPWNLLALGLVVPRALRDAVYDLIARHRHRLVRGGDACAMPDDAVRQRLWRE